MKTRLLLSLPLLARVLTAQETCAISGTVVDDANGRPAFHVKVFAGPADAAEDHGEAIPSMRRLTNTNGQFCFEQLSPGSYEIATQKAGYLETTRWGRDRNSPALVISVSTNQPPLPPLVLKITPQAVINGVVTDAEGDPISFAEVRLWKRSKLKDKTADLKAVQADEQGHFRLWSVAPGRYYISALPQFPTPENRARANTLDGFGHPLKEREVETFYKDALAIGGATPIDVKAGQEITGLRISVLQTASRRISGRVSPDSQSDGGLPHLLLVSPRGGMFNSIKLQTDGSFQVEGLAPGKYSLIAIAPSGDARITKEVDVTGADAGGVLLQPVKTFSIKVSARVEGSTKALAMDEFYLENAAGSGGRSANQDEDGTWRFSGLAPDIYHFMLVSNPEHYFVKRVAIDGEPGVGSVIDLRARRPQNIEVVLAVATSSIAVEMTHGKNPAPVPTIVLMDAVTEEMVKVQSSPADGHVDIRSLAPGKYRVYAFEDFDRETWASKELRALLAPKSVLIDLHDREKSKVSVPLISTSESDAGLDKVEH